MNVLGFSFVISKKGVGEHFNHGQFLGVIFTGGGYEGTFAGTPPCCR